MELFPAVFYVWVTRANGWFPLHLIQVALRDVVGRTVNTAYFVIAHQPGIKTFSAVPLFNYHLFHSDSTQGFAVTLPFRHPPTPMQPTRQPVTHGSCTQALIQFIGFHWTDIAAWFCHLRSGWTIVTIAILKSDFSITERIEGPAQLV
jgi:hypothetical protein